MHEVYKLANGVMFVLELSK